MAKPELGYSGPPGVTLDPVEAQVTTTCSSASPDALAWTTLKAFLAATTQTLTVGLYDFTWRTSCRRSRTACRASS